MGEGNIPQMAGRDSPPNSSSHANVHPSQLHKLRQVTSPLGASLPRQKTPVAEAPAKAEPITSASGTSTTLGRYPRLPLPFLSPTSLLGKVTRLWVGCIRQ